MWSTAALVFVISLFATYMLLPRLSNIASKIGLVDHPSQRKIHMEPKPLVGGIAMMAGICLTSILFVPLTNLRGVFAGMTILVVTGFLDDFKELDHRLKFLAQICAAAAMMIFSKTVLHNFGNLLAFGDIELGVLSVAITIISTVGVINALNMIDGLDGLSGGVSLVAFLSFSVFAYINGQTHLVLLNLAFCGALVAFLRYNVHPARLFMGDAGSMMLGFSLAFMSIAVTQGKCCVVPPVGPLLVLAVPIVDTLIVMTIRKVSGKSPFNADRLHFHHVLLRFGFNRTAVVLIIVSLTAGFSVFATAGTLLEIPDYYMFAVFMAYFFLCLIASIKLKKVYRASLRGEMPFGIGKDR
jgi:UDP-GlcNAc:undecaprenyl-phosphate GlcNAc-1-phosphate transferase